MSKYTTQLRYLIDTNFNFGLNEYPIFDENYRAILNKKILDHYRFREIGAETAGLFKHYLNTTLNEIMPYYNVLYTNQLAMIGKDIFTNYSLTEELERNADGTSSSSSNSSSSGTGESKNVDSDTPQGAILNSDVNNYEYATSANISDNSNSNSINDSSTVASNNTENYIKRTYGNIGVRNYAEDLGALAKNLMNIDLEIINKLQDCFMQIY